MPGATIDNGALLEQFLLWRANRIKVFVQLDEIIMGIVAEALRVGRIHALHAFFLLASGPLIMKLHAAADESVVARRGTMFTLSVKCALCFRAVLTCQTLTNIVRASFILVLVKLVLTHSSHLLARVLHGLISVGHPLPLIRLAGRIV